MKKTRLLVVEDEALYRELLCRTLSAEPSLEIIEVAEDGQKALQIAFQKKPDVVLMDIELPGSMDGIQTALLIKKERPKTGIVILSAHSERCYVTSLPLDNIQGWAYLLKQTVPDMDTVVRAIQGSKVGMLVLDPAIIAGLKPRQGSALARLNPRHQEVLELLAQGYNNSAIANLMKLSRKSIETYINSIYQELQLSHEEGIHARVKAALIYLESSKNRQG